MLIECSDYNRVNGSSSIPLLLQDIVRSKLFMKTFDQWKSSNKWTFHSNQHWTEVTLALLLQKFASWSQGSYIRFPQKPWLTLSFSFGLVSNNDTLACIYFLSRLENYGRFIICKSDQCILQKSKSRWTVRNSSISKRLIALLRCAMLLYHY